MLRLVYDILNIIRYKTWNQSVFYCALLSLLPAASVLITPGLIGFEGAEVYGHAWSYWWRAEAFPGWPSGTDLAHGTQHWPAIDSIPTLFCILLAQVTGPLLAYNSWLLFSRWLLALGGWLLAERTNGSPQAGAFIAAFFSPFIGAQYSGLTEDFGLGLALIGFSYLLESKKRSILKGGIFLGLVPWCGLVLGWYTALVGLFVGIVLLLRLNSWRLRLSLFASGLMAVVVGGLSAIPHWSRLIGFGHRYEGLEFDYQPLWTLNPLKSVDILSLIAPVHQNFSGFIMRLHPGYLGICVVLAALIGTKREKYWWILLALIVGIALGPVFMWKGTLTDISNPVWSVFTALPGFTLMNHYGRALLLAAVPLVILAARGARHWAIHLMVVLDLIFLAPLSPLLPIAPSTSLPSLTYLNDLPQGDIVILPASGPNIHPQKPFWQQHQHGRKIWLSPNRLGIPAALIPYQSIRQLAEKPSLFDMESSDFPCFIAALLVRDFYALPYQEVLGDPDAKDDEYWVWSHKRLSTDTNCGIKN